MKNQFQNKTFEIKFTLENEKLNFYVLPLVMSLHWSLHHQESRQEMDEDSPDPGRHEVCLRRAEVNVEDHNCHAYTESDAQ